MKRIPRWSWLTGVAVAALSLMCLTPATYAQPNGYYYSGGNVPGYGGYPIYGQGPYVYRTPPGYYYPANGGYVYQGYGAGPYGSASGYARTHYFGAYSPYNRVLESPYDNPNYYPLGLRSYNEIYRSHHGF